MTSVNGRWTGPAGVFSCVRAGLALVVALELAGAAVATAQVRVATLGRAARDVGPWRRRSQSSTLEGIRSAGGCSASGTPISTSVPIPASFLDSSVTWTSRSRSTPSSRSSGLATLCGTASSSGQRSARGVSARCSFTPLRSTATRSTSGRRSIWHTRPCQRELAHSWAGRSIPRTRNRTSGSTGAPRRRPR